MWVKYRFSFKLDWQTGILKYREIRDVLFTFPTLPLSLQLFGSLSTSRLSASNHCHRQGLAKNQHDE